MDEETVSTLPSPGFQQFAGHVGILRVRELGLDPHVEFPPGSHLSSNFLFVRGHQPDHIGDPPSPVFSLTSQSEDGI